MVMLAYVYKGRTASGGVDRHVSDLRGDAGADRNHRHGHSTGWRHGHSLGHRTAGKQNRLFQVSHVTDVVCL